MAITTTSVSVGTSAVPIATGLPFAQPDSRALVISNLGTNPVFIGGPTVTATTGVQVAAGTNFTLLSNGRSDVWAIAATGTNNVVVGVFS